MLPIERMTHINQMRFEQMRIKGFQKGDLDDCYLDGIIIKDLPNNFKITDSRFLECRLQEMALDSLNMASVEKYVITCDTGVFKVKKDHNNDECGHGTLCSSVIFKECSNIDLVSVKIFEDGSQTNILYLEEALKFLLEVNVDIINLSISIENNQDTRGVKFLCNQLSSQGKIIVSSVENGKSHSKPADFNSVIGVRGVTLNSKKYWFNSKNKRCIADNLPYLHYKGNGQYEMFGLSNSYSAAMMAGKIAKIISSGVYSNVNEKYKAVEQAAENRFWNRWSIKNSIAFPEFKNTKMIYQRVRLHELINILEEFFCIADQELFFKYSLFSSKIGKDLSFCFELCIYLEQYYNFSFDRYEKLSKYDFASIYSLYTVLERELKWET